MWLSTSPRLNRCRDASRRRTNKRLVSLSFSAQYISKKAGKPDAKNDAGLWEFDGAGEATKSLIVFALADSDLVAPYACELVKQPIQVRRGPVRQPGKG